MLTPFLNLLHFLWEHGKILQGLHTHTDSFSSLIDQILSSMIDRFTVTIYKQTHFVRCATYSPILSFLTWAWLSAPNFLYTAECDDGDLRLAGGDSENDGLLQVCFSGRWGTVNRDGWTDVDTHVACRQLGFNNTGNTGIKHTSTSTQDIFTVSQNIDNIRIFFLTGTYSTKTATGRSISTPIQMDNVGCYGTEARLIDCAYDMETIIDYTDDYSEDYASEDTHYGDVWIDCSSSTSTTSGPDGCKGNTDCIKTPGDEIDSGGNNAKSKDKSSSEADSDEGNDVALILAVVAFVGFVLVSTVIISFIVYFIWKKGGARQSMRWV